MVYYKNISNGNGNENIFEIDEKSHKTYQYDFIQGKWIESNFFNETSLKEIKIKMVSEEEVSRLIDKNYIPSELDNIEYRMNNCNKEDNNLEFWEAIYNNLQKIKNIAKDDKTILRAEARLHEVCFILSYYKNAKKGNSAIYKKGKNHV